MKIRLIKGKDYFPKSILARESFDLLMLINKSVWDIKALRKKYRKENNPILKKSIYHKILLNQDIIKKLWFVISTNQKRIGEK